MSANIAGEYTANGEQRGKRNVRLVNSKAFRAFIALGITGGALANPTSADAVLEGLTLRTTCVAQPAPGVQGRAKVVSQRPDDVKGMLAILRPDGSLEEIAPFTAFGNDETTSGPLPQQAEDQNIVFNSPDLGDRTNLAKVNCQPDQPPVTSSTTSTTAPAAERPPTTATTTTSTTVLTPTPQAGGGGNGSLPEQSTPHSVAPGAVAVPVTRLGLTG